jgi:hypothetical protein
MLALFNYTPVLKYLNVKTLQKYSNNTTSRATTLANEYAVHLKRLSIDDCECTFDLIEILLQRTPNLKI